MVKNAKDFAFGMVCMMLGVAFALGAHDYRIGTAANMESGYFPFHVACLLGLVGLGIATSALRGEQQEQAGWWRIRLRPAVFILGANIMFGILLVGLPSWGLPSMGLLPAVFVTVVVAALAGPEFVLREALILAVLMALLCAVVFVLLLKLNMSLFPAFLY